MMFNIDKRWLEHLKNVTGIEVTMDQLREANNIRRDERNLKSLKAKSDRSEYEDRLLDHLIKSLSGTH